MADLFCRFLYFRSHTTNHNIPLFLPPNRYYSSPLHSHNSRITSIKTSSPRLLLLFKPSPFTPSASGIDIISTQEHSDGSFLFRFGDSSEVQENVEMEESKAVKEEIEGEDKIGSSVVEDVDGDDETEVTEAIDSADLIGSSSNAVIVVEGVGELSEKLLEGSDDVELPSLTSNEEMRGISNLDLDIEHIKSAESLNEEFKDLVPVGASVPDESLQVENVVTEVEMSYMESREETSSVASITKETESFSIPDVDVNVEECVNQEDEDSSENESMLDQSSEVVNDITAVALSEKEGDGITSADIEVDQTEKVEECLNQDYEETPKNEIMLDQSSQVVDDITAVALLEKETNGITSADVEADQTVKVEECLSQENEDSSADVSMPDQSSEVVDNISAVDLSEKESDGITAADVESDQSGKVDESLNKDDENSPADESMLVQCSEVVDNISTEALSGKESDGITSADVEADQTGKVEEFLIQDDEDSPEDESMLDQSSEVLSTVALSEKESDDITSADVEVDQTGKVEECLSQENEDSSANESMIDHSSEVVDNTSALASSEKESDDVTSADVELDQTGKIEESMLDQSSEVADNISTVAWSEKESDDITSADVELDQTGKVGEFLCQKDEDSLADESMLDQSSEVADNISTVALSEKESDDITSADVEADQTGKVEEFLSQKNEDSPADESMLDNISTVAWSEKESDDITSADVELDQTGKVGEFLCQKDEDSLADESMLDQSSEVADNISTVALSEKESDDITSADVEADQTGKVEEFLSQKNEDSPADESMLDQNFEAVDNHSTVSMMEKESDEINSADIEADKNGKLEEDLNGDEEDSPVDNALLDKSAELVNGLSVVPLLGKETDGITSISDIEIEPTGNMEERINEEYEDSLVDTSDLDKKSDALNTITTAAASEKETADITADPDIDINYTVNVEQGLDKVDKETSAVEQGLDEVDEEPIPVQQGLDEVVEEPSAVEQGLDEVHEGPSAVDASRPNKMPEADNNITAQDFPGKETADATTLVALKTDPVVSVLDTDAYKGSLESAITTNVAHISEAQNVESVIQDEIIGDGRENLDDNLVYPSSQMESGPAMSLYKETEEPNFENLATKESSETDMNNVNALEVQNELGNNDERDIYGAEAEFPKTGPAMILSIGSEEQASGSRSGVPNETVGHVSENDMIQVLTVPPQLEAYSMLEEETGTDTVEEPREDEVSENQTVGGDLVEASVLEVTTPESAQSTLTSQEMLVTDFVLSSGAALLPHPSKVLTGGEDAYFIAGQTWLGVADGVSQWSLEGTFPGVHAQELVKNCEDLISDCNGNSINNPIELLNLSIAQTHSPGFSTILIAKFDGQALHVANVGDSGFIVLRHGAVYKRSSPMHHAFSLPVHIERGDDPSSLAQFYRVDLEEEDVIVVATDGLLDNLYDQEILLITMKSLAHNKSLEEIAELLAKKAQEVGRSTSVRSPFADGAQATGFPGYTGGKLDDVAVIVSVVQRR